MSMSLRDGFKPLGVQGTPLDSLELAAGSSCLFWCTASALAVESSASASAAVPALVHIIVVSSFRDQH